MVCESYIDALRAFDPHLRLQIDQTVEIMIPPSRAVTRTQALFREAGGLPWDRRRSRQLMCNSTD